MTHSVPFVGRMTAGEEAKRVMRVDGVVVFSHWCSSRFNVAISRRNHTTQKQPLLSTEGMRKGKQVPVSSMGARRSLCFSFWLVSAEM